MDKSHFELIHKAYIDTATNPKSMSREEFSKAIKKLEGLHIAKTPFPDRLFDLFDVKKQGSISLPQFLLGFAQILAGTEAERLKMTFQAYDLDGNGFISFDELVNMLQHAWLAGLDALQQEEEGEDYVPSPNPDPELLSFSKELATGFAEKTFAVLDRDRDRRLSYQEFCLFAKRDPDLHVTLNGLQNHVILTFLRDQLPVSEA